MLKRLLAVLTVVLVGVAIGPVGAYAAPTIGEYHSTRGIESNKCMTDHGANLNNGADIDIFTCVANAEHNQQWIYVLYTQPYYFIQLYGTNKCLTVRGGGGVDGTPLELWDCLTSPVQPNQLWWTTDSGQSTANWAIKAYGSNKCVTVHGGGSANNTPIDIWTCLGGQGNQFWYEGGEG